MLANSNERGHEFEGGRVIFLAATGLIKRWGQLISLLAVIGIVAGCSGSPSPDEYEEETYSVNDPLEDVNRVTFAVNQTIDGLILKPAAEMYVGIVPEWGRNRVNDALNNLGEPVIFANALLQLNMQRAVTSMLRFAFNSTIGLAGLFDVAEGVGLSYVDEDFGQTLGVWGMGEGPYLVLPLFGPSNPRDAFGMGVDWLLDPISRALRDHENYQRMIARGIDRRSAHLEDLETLQETSIDFYAAMRELYRQHRANEIRDGELPSLLPIPSFTHEEFSEDEFDQASAKGEMEEQ
tara:strand:- start:1449 stop:2327 length:879 start_codon:yes stop_codon:yes gene_type:complete